MAMFAAVVLLFPSLCNLIVFCVDVEEDDIPRFEGRIGTNRIILVHSSISSEVGYRCAKLNRILVKVKEQEVKVS